MTGVYELVVGGLIGGPLSCWSSSKSEVIYSVTHPKSSERFTMIAWLAADNLSPLRAHPIVSREKILIVKPPFDIDSKS